MSTSEVELTGKYRLLLKPALVEPAKRWVERNYPTQRLIRVWDLVEYLGSCWLPTSFGVTLTHDDDNGHRILTIRSGIRGVGVSDAAWVVYHDLPLPNEEVIRERVVNALTRTILPHYNGELPLTPKGNYEHWVGKGMADEQIPTPICPMADV